MDFFQLATNLARQEGAKTLAAVAVKSIAAKSYRNRGETCGCSAYQFPHRVGGGNCPGISTRNYEDQESLRLFDANEASWINGGCK
jgi:hypothetical protein